MTSKGSRKEALIITWSDDDLSDFDGDVCLMAIDNEVLSSLSNISYNKLTSMYNELCKEIVKLQKEENILKEMIISVRNEFDVFKYEYNKLNDKNANRYLKY